MIRFRSVLFLVLLLRASGLHAQILEPREQSYQFFVDGVLTAGVVGYKLDFNHDPLSRSESRRLDSAYSPDVHHLSITVTPKGLNRLQSWLNSATTTGNAAAKNVSLIVRQPDNTVLARWDLTGAIPQTFSSAASGAVASIDSEVGFYYDTLTLVQAKPD